MISTKYNCIFVHIPKAGGTSIEDVLWPSKSDRVATNLWGGFLDKYSNKYQTGGLQHLLGVQIRQEVGEDIFSQFYKFTFVRNPWDKAVSQYSYIKTRKDLMQLIGMHERDEFKKYLSLIDKTPHVQWEHQHKFFLDENGENIVDFIGRLDSIQEDLKHVLEVLDFRSGILRRKKSKIPHAKKSLRGKYQDYYDAESIAMVSDMYALDIKILNYKYDDL